MAGPTLSPLFFLKAPRSLARLFLKKGNYKMTRVVVDNGEEYVRVYPKQKDKEGNFIEIV